MDDVMSSATPSEELPTFTVNGHAFKAERLHMGVLVNPELPAAFHITPNEARPADEQKWWHLPYIVAVTLEDLDRHFAADASERQREHWALTGRAEFKRDWPFGCYHVFCLDGRAWNGPSKCGRYSTLDEAATVASRCFPELPRIRR